MGKSVSTFLNCCFGRDEKVLDKPDVKPKMTPDLMTDTDLIRKTFYHRPINIENLVNSKLLNLNQHTTVLKQMFETFDFDRDEIKKQMNSFSVKQKLKRAVILPDAMHSDHCPILVEIE